MQDVAFESPEKIAGKSICIDIATIIDDCQSNHYLGPWPAMPQHRKCSEYINFCSTSSVFNSLNTVITTKRCEKSCNVNITLVPQLLKEQYFYTSLNLSVILSYVHVQCLDFVTRIRSLYPNVFLYPFEVKYHTHTHTHTHTSPSLSQQWSCSLMVKWSNLKQTDGLTTTTPPPKRSSLVYPAPHRTKWTQLWQLPNRLFLLGEKGVWWLGRMSCFSFGSWSRRIWSVEALIRVMLVECYWQSEEVKYIYTCMTL